MRRIINNIGFPSDKTQSFRTIKLLDLLLKYFYTATVAGLSPSNNRSEILNRLDENKDLVIISELYALNAIRQLDAHGISKNADQKLNDALQVFEISKKGLSSNYAKACDQIYDKLDEMFINLNSFLLKAFDFE